MNWEPAIQVATPIVGAVLTFFLARLTKRAMDWLDSNTAIKLTDQQRATILSAISTASGLLQQKVQSGKITVADITPDSANVQAAVQHVIDSVPDALKALDVTPQSIANMVVASFAKKSPATQPVMVPAYQVVGGNLLGTNQPIQ